MKKLTIASILIFLSLFGISQKVDSVQMKAMDKLSWLAGEWEGVAITQMGPDKTDTVIMNEYIRYDLNSTILIINGKGHMKDKDVLVHDAMAIISFNNYTGKYRWHSWRVPGGYYSEYEPMITEKGLSWNMKTLQGMMRYNLEFNEKGEWHETGEFSNNNENWNTFFEMHLKRVSN